MLNQKKKNGSCMDTKDMEGQLIGYLIQRRAGEDIFSEEGWLHVLGTWALTKKEEAQSRGKTLFRKSGSKPFIVSVKSRLGVVHVSVTVFVVSSKDLSINCLS